MRTLWSVSSTILFMCSILYEPQAASCWEGMSCNNFVSSHISYQAAPPKRASRDAPTSTLGAGSTCDGASHRSSTFGRCSPLSVCCFLCSAVLGLRGPNAASQPPLAGPASMNSSHSAFSDNAFVRDPPAHRWRFESSSVSSGTFCYLHLQGWQFLMVREARECRGR